MTITLEQIQELRKGITPGEWKIDPTEQNIVSIHDGKTYHVLLAFHEITRDGQAISLVPELLEMAESYIKMREVCEILVHALSPDSMEKHWVHPLRALDFAIARRNELCELDPTLEG